MNLPDSYTDVARHMLAQPNAEKHMHRINRGDHPGTAKRSDFDPGGVETPARPSRALIEPSVANDKRRTPFFDVTSIESPPGKPSEGDDYARHAAHSSTATPTPKKL
jgi:hypothetical protein